MTTDTSNPEPRDVLRVTLRSDGTVLVWQEEAGTTAELAFLLRVIAYGFENDPKRVG